MTSGGSRDRTSGSSGAELNEGRSSRPSPLTGATPVDLVVTAGTPATVAAQQATQTIPIVFTLASDPVETGLVASFARPGGNLTGVAVGLYDEKLIEILKEAIPGLSRIAYVTQPEAPATRFARMTAAARTLGIQLTA